MGEQTWRGTRRRDHSGSKKKIGTNVIIERKAKNQRSVIDRLSRSMLASTMQLIEINTEGLLEAASHLTSM
jgi:hypothetical protein